MKPGFARQGFDTNPIRTHFFKLSYFFLVVQPIPPPSPLLVVRPLKKIAASLRNIELKPLLGARCDEPTL